MSEEDYENMLKRLSITELEFPCGFKISTTKEIIKDYNKITCPLHGKDCINKSIRILEEIK